MSLINKEVAAFSAKAYKNGQIIDVTKDDLLGKWSVFCFYPADFSNVCPSELVDLAEHQEDFAKIGCEIYTISTDTHHVHKAWRESTPELKDVRYAMIADPSHVLSKEFEVLDEALGIAVRGSFVINKEAKILAYEVNATSIARDASELLRRVQAAQFVEKNGQACLAKWRPDEPTLKPIFDLKKRG